MNTENLSLSERLRRVDEGVLKTLSTDKARALAVACARLALVCARACPSSGIQEVRRLDAVERCLEEPSAENRRSVIPSGQDSRPGMDWTLWAAWACVWAFDGQKGAESSAIAAAARAVRDAELRGGPPVEALKKANDMLTAAVITATAVVQPSTSLRPDFSSTQEESINLCINMQAAVRALREDAARISLDVDPDVLAAQLARLAAAANQAALLAAQLHGVRSASRWFED